jgi:hypothetical protein
MQPESSNNTGPASDATETSEPSTGAPSNQLTLFAEAFPVSRIRSLVNGWQPPTIAISGLKSSDAFAELSPDGSWVKTSAGCCQANLDGSLEQFCETWPRAGMTRSGTAYQRAPSAPLTREIGSGSLPTPTVGDSKSARNSTANRSKMPPTGIHAGDTLTDYVTLWPTPSARDWKSETCSPEFQAKRMAHTRGKALSVMALLPTPTAHRWDGLQSHGVNVVSGSLNPTWVEWLMGYPLGWTDCGDSGTRSSRKSRSGSSGG